MSTPPPVPAVPDADRYFTATVSTTVLATQAVPFPVYGDGTDLDVLWNGAPLSPQLWSFFSAASPGSDPAMLPKPITDGTINFSPALSGGQLEIVGDMHPRLLTMPTAPGIARREFNQTSGGIFSILRELWRAVRSQRAAAIRLDQTGPLSQRATYDAAVPPFFYLQTDDAQNRAVYYAKMSANLGDWSGPLVLSGAPGASAYALAVAGGYQGSLAQWLASLAGAPGANGAFAATDPVVPSVLPTDTLPILSNGASKRVSRDALLATIPPGLRVAALWSGDGQGVVGQSGCAAAAIMADGTLRAWGFGTDNGNGDTAGQNRWTPKTIGISPANAAAPTLPFVQVARCGTSLWALDSAGLVYAMGGNAAGQLGVGSTTSLTQLTLVASLQSAGVKVASIVPQPGSYQNTGATVYFLTTIGQVYSCGNNAAGQIGDGTTTSRAVPVRCGLLTNIVKVAPAIDYNRSMFVMALDGAGNLYAWGVNTYGQLGDGSTANRSSPFLTLTGVADVATCMANQSTPAVGGHAVAVMTDGTVRTIGLNASGQLGVGDTINRAAWTQPTGVVATALKAYAGGGYYGYSGVLLSDKTVRLWGSNAAGQLGTGDTTNRLSPYNPAGTFQGKVAAVHMFGFYVNTLAATAMLCTDGTIWASGNNATGTLGQGNGFINISTFSPITLPPGETSPVTALKFAGPAGFEGTLFALLANGELYATGGNLDGRLGTQVGNLHSVDGLEKVIFT